MNTTCPFVQFKPLLAKSLLFSQASCSSQPIFSLPPCFLFAFRFAWLVFCLTYHDFLKIALIAIAYSVWFADTAQFTTWALKQNAGRSLALWILSRARISVFDFLAHLSSALLRIPLASWISLFVSALEFLSLFRQRRRLTLSFCFWELLYLWLGRIWCLSSRARFLSFETHLRSLHSMHWLGWRQTSDSLSPELLHLSFSLQLLFEFLSADFKPSLR